MRRCGKRYGSKEEAERSKKGRTGHYLPYKCMCKGWHLEELILNYQQDKYSTVPLAAVWAKELRRKEENRHLTANEILELALHDVLSGRVDWKTVKKALTASAKEEAGLLQALKEPKKSKD